MQTQLNRRSFGAQLDLKSLSTQVQVNTDVPGTSAE